MNQAHCILVASLTLRSLYCHLQIVQAAPVRQARSPEDEAEFWRNKGNEYFKFRDFVRAKTSYTSSIEAVPSAAAFANRALAGMKLKEWQQAEADCSEV